MSRFWNSITDSIGSFWGTKKHQASKTFYYAENLADHVMEPPKRFFRNLEGASNNLYNIAGKVVGAENISPDLHRERELHRKKYSINFANRLDSQQIYKFRFNVNGVQFESKFNKGMTKIKVPIKCPNGKVEYFRFGVMMDSTGCVFVKKYNTNPKKKEFQTVTKSQLIADAEEQGISLKVFALR